MTVFVLFLSVFIRQEMICEFFPLDSAQRDFLLKDTCIMGVPSEIMYIHPSLKVSQS